MTGFFIVVEGRHECLMSNAMATGLGMISFKSCGNPVVKAVYPAQETPTEAVMVDRYTHTTKEELKTKFPSLFSGKLGCLKGVAIKIDVDPSVKPVAQKLRQVPVHLQKAIEHEILKQVDEGIDRNSGPTPWISNLVIVPKGEGGGHQRHERDLRSALIHTRSATYL